MSHNNLAKPSRRFFVAASLAGLLAFGLAGCGGDTGTGPTKMVPLTLVAQGVGGSAARYLAPAGSVFTTATADTDTIPVTFTRALLVVRDVRLVRPEMMMDDSTGQSDSLGATDSLDVEEGDDQGQVRFRGPFVIDLLSGHAARLDSMMVQPGDYARVQGHLQMLRAGDADAVDFPSLVGSTVWIEGTIDGDGGGPFAFLARIDNEFMIRGGFHVDAETPATAFVTFDVTKWLQDRDGHFLDPRDPLNEMAIKSAIRHSIKVGMDDDHDGQMDDRMHWEDGD
ncbi:MAG TPA: hypothetical protein VFS09_07320 [Candidatus Eisenbacteria bacterium]|nr:hypothetical protein [Candidatus Eisenbacteria bacterium]